MVYSDIQTYCVRYKITINFGFLFRNMATLTGNGQLVADWINNIFGFPMYLVGMCGNILTLVVLLSSRGFRSTAFGILLMLLCLMDMGVLSTSLLRHCLRGLTSNGVQVRNMCQWCCKIHVYLTYVFAEMSPWTLCLVTLERTLAVTCPLKKEHLFTKRRMFAAWLTIFVLVTSFNAVLMEKMRLFPDQVAPDQNTMTQSPTITSTEFVTTEMIVTVKVPHVFWCYFKQPDFFMEHVMPVVFVFLSYIIPGVTVLIMNVILYRGLRRAQQVRTSLRNSPDDDSAGSRLNSDTRMMVGISVLFILDLTNIPLAVYYIYYHYWRSFDKNVAQIVYAVLLDISCINNAFNFVMYCFRGQKFRSALRELVCCNRKRTGRPARRDKNRNEIQGQVARAQNLQLFCRIITCRKNLAIRHSRV